MARGPAALRNVKEPPVGRQPLAMMAQSGIVPEIPARFGEQGAVLRHLERSELCARRTENLAYVRFRDVGENELHGRLLPERFGFGVIHERLEFFVGLELRSVVTKRGKTFLTGTP